MQIKAIETLYADHRFRSRLEARWAVFFDAIGIKWVYEPEGFELSDGSRYLPDFYLPTFDGGMWCEVKPDAEHFGKAKQFCREARAKVWLCDGVPDCRVYTVVDHCSGIELEEYFGLPNADQAEGEDRMFVFPGYEDQDGTIPKDYWDCLGTQYVDAVRKAKQARFEFGDIGAGA